MRKVEEKEREKNAKEQKNKTTVESESCVFWKRKAELKQHDRKSRVSLMFEIMKTGVCWVCIYNL